MRRVPLLIVWLTGALLFADIVVLKDGRQLSGTVESGNTQELHIKVGDQSQTIDIHDVQAIRFTAPTPAPNPPKAADAAANQPNNLILNDGTQIAGRWWSLDATQMHFLVNNQLQHYPRHDVLGVTFDGATLPALPQTATPQSATAPTQPPAAAPQPATQPARAPTLMRPSSGGASPSSAPRSLSQPEEIGAVYFYNGKGVGLTALEKKQAVERRSGSNDYYEVPGLKSPIRVEAAERMVFILRLPKGVRPQGYSLFVLDSVNGARRTKMEPGRRGGLVTWPVDIAINDESSLITYALTVRDLPAGEYSFSPEGSNDSYCFGIDPTPAGQ